MPTLKDLEYKSKHQREQGLSVFNIKFHQDLDRLQERLNEQRLKIDAMQPPSRKDQEIPDDPTPDPDKAISDQIRLHNGDLINRGDIYRDIQGLMTAYQTQFLGHVNYMEIKQRELSDLHKGVLAIMTEMKTKIEGLVSNYGMEEPHWDIVSKADAAPKPNVTSYIPQGSKRPFAVVYPKASK